MEFEAYKDFVIPNLIDERPTSPGLYLYATYNNSPLNHVEVNLVEVRYQNDTLIADSDDWETFLAVDLIHKFIPGKWSSKIDFS